MTTEPQPLPQLTNPSPGWIATLWGKLPNEEQQLLEGLALALLTTPGFTTFHGSFSKDLLTADGTWVAYVVLHYIRDGIMHRLIPGGH